MRYYEIVLLIYPDKTNYINSIVSYYTKFINDRKGKIFRLEDWGLKYLSYSINKMYKAHYLLINININKDKIKCIEKNFSQNDSILRFLIVKKKKLEIKPSVMCRKNVTLDNSLFKLNDFN